MRKIILYFNSLCKGKYLEKGLGRRRISWLQNLRVTAHQSCFASQPTGSALLKWLPTFEIRWASKEEES